MLGVLIIPTGISAEIGGHAGDGNPVAKLIASCCDKLIVHPNVVNAADINEMPANCLYVEGSSLDRFLEGHLVLLERSRPNKVLVVANAPVCPQTINAVNAACATIGLDAEIVELDTPLQMIASIKDGVASGEVIGAEALINQVSNYEFDALAIHTPIHVSRVVALYYYRNGGVNPWGGVEALASKMISSAIHKPVAHAPREREDVQNDVELYKIFDEVVDPRIASEAVSVCYLHCVLKGLHRAPLLRNVTTDGFHVRDVDFMVSPSRCFSRPHVACIAADIPIIVVKENKTCLQQPCPGAIVVENYWEAAGVIMSWKAGIHRDSVRRPLKTLLPTKDSEETKVTAK